MSLTAMTKKYWALFRKYFKHLLHPIVRVHTRKCAANIVEKDERSLVVG